jgi:hypothetical protein
VRNNAKQQLANVKQAAKAGGARAVPATLRLAAALPSKGRSKPTKRKELRDEVRSFLDEGHILQAAKKAALPRHTHTALA